MSSPCGEPGLRGAGVENVGVLVEGLYSLLVGENDGLLLVLVEKLGKVL